jgi:hypothetical protein
MRQSRLHIGLFGIAGALIGEYGERSGSMPEAENERLFSIRKYVAGDRAIQIDQMAMSLMSRKMINAKLAFGLVCSARMERRSSDRQVRCS